jgi:formylglycine-generating enzyme required for sulfatase activity
MGGNVWQMCDDWYRASMNSDEVKEQIPDLAGDGGGHLYKVARGASWVSGYPVYLLSAYRDRLGPASTLGYYGFRLVVSIANAEQPPLETTPAPPVVHGLPKSGQIWINSLGLKFMPAGTDGVLFCAFDVRVKDYQQFVTATGQEWPKPNYFGSTFVQTENDPAVMVSWNDAEAFCDWLTRKEQTAGLLGANQSYRLPKDEEWSRAAGSGKNPWGDNYPPPLDAGNYYRKGDAPNYTGSPFEGTDGYPYTSPVGQFQPNSFGLFDMGGNVWQWSDDWYDDSVNAKNAFKLDTGDGHSYKVVRGASWNVTVPVGLLTACRYEYNPSLRDPSVGFRLVVDVSP